MIKTGNQIGGECLRDESVETAIDFDRALRIAKRDKRNGKTDKNMMARGHNRVNSVENFECPAQKLIELGDEEPGTLRSSLEQTFNELIGEQSVVSQPSEEKKAKNEKNDRNVSNDN